MTLSIILILLAVPAFFVIRAMRQTRQLAEHAEQSVPQAGQLQPVNGGTIHYVAMGPKDAPPVVLIHGISGQLQHYTFAIADLLATDYRVYAVDRPGCGYSTRDGEDKAAVRAQAAMIAEFIEKQGIEKPLIVGHSLGGAVSLALAMDRPDLPSGLALLCPATHDAGDVPPVFKGLDIKSHALRNFLAHTFAIPLALKTAPKVLKAVFAPETHPETFLTDAGGLLGLRPQAFITSVEDLHAARAAAHELSSTYGEKLKTPGGVLYGADDKVLSAKVHGESMTQFGLVYETLAGCGHMIPITKPEACVDFIRRMDQRG